MESEGINRDDPRFFRIRSRSVGEVAERCGAELGDSEMADGKITSIRSVEEAIPGALCFLSDPRYLTQAGRIEAAAVICRREHADQLPDSVAKLIHPNPHLAWAKALGFLYPEALRPLPAARDESGISPLACVAPDAALEENVLVEPFAVIGKGAHIGSGTRILAGAIIGSDVRIGRDCTIGFHASVEHALIGNRVILHPGARVGQDGFGFAMSREGHEKIPQVGRAIIQDDVELGANSCVDRGSNRDTIIGEGSRIDNLVQIGHNAVIGRGCVIVGQAGVPGSAKLEDHVILGGQSGLKGHITVGEGAVITGGSRVFSDVPAGATRIGFPAADMRSWARFTRTLRKKGTSADGASAEGGDGEGSGEADGGGDRGES